MTDKVVLKGTHCTEVVSFSVRQVCRSKDDVHHRRRGRIVNYSMFLWLDPIRIFFWGGRTPHVFDSRDQQLHMCYNTTQFIFFLSGKPAQELVWDIVSLVGSLEPRLPYYSVWKWSTGNLQSEQMMCLLKIQWTAVAE